MKVCVVGTGYVGLTTGVSLAFLGHDVTCVEIDQSKVDKSTEIWLDSIEDRLTYQRWYAGHYHTEKEIDRLILLFESIREFKA